MGPIGEEDCLRGCGGSGTIFFSLCNVRCVFCQNREISQRPVGDELTPERLAKAADYSERARQAIQEMHRQVGPLMFGPDGLARRGVLVRHLVMPGQSSEAASIFRWLAN